MNVRLRLIIIALAIAGGVFYLWDTYQYEQINSEREALEGDSAALAQWDSLHKDDWLDAREGRIKLGLDLRGGVYVTMEVDVVALVEESADRGLVDQTFEKVMAAVREETRTSDEPVIDIFEQKFNEIARPEGKTMLDYFALDISGDISDEAILEKLRQNANDAVNQAREVITQRINRYGVSESSVTKQGSRRLVVEVPDEKDPSRVRDLLSRTARLEFKLVRNDAEITKIFKQIDAELSTEEQDAVDEGADEADVTDTDQESAAGDDGDVVEAADGDETGTDETDHADLEENGDTVADDSDTAVDGQAADTTDDTVDNPYEGLAEEEQVEKYRSLHPFTSNFATYFQQGRTGQMQDATGIYDNPVAQIPQGEYSYFISREGIQKVQDFLRRPEIRAMIPEDRQIVFSANPRDPQDPESPYEMIVLKAEPELRGEVVTDAVGTTDFQTGQPVVQMTMDLFGAERWAQITEDNVNKRVAVVLDSAVYSAPWIEEKIPGGQTRITGSADLKEAELLATVLKSGALKAPIRIIEERIVGPSLGQDQINQGVNAVLFAALLVILFMIMYYMLGGIVADLAVVMNVFLTLAVLAAFQGTLTLPGIGALVLTIGMAVDANILIYERIREELALGKGLRHAVQLGYEKAFSAIIDSNITTFITGVILYSFGSGPIKGFALMLMIGIGATLFTAVFVTRAIFMLMLDRGIEKLNFGQPKTRSAG